MWVVVALEVSLKQEVCLAPRPHPKQLLTFIFFVFLGRDQTALICERITFPVKVCNLEEGMCYESLYASCNHKHL